MRRRLVLVPSITVVAAVLAACGGSDAGSSPADDLRARAQAGAGQSYTATYDVSGAKPGSDATVTVHRTPASLRLDVKTATGVATSISTASGVVACEQPVGGKPPTCLTVAGPGASPPAAFDPALRSVFGDDLRLLASGDDGIDVTTPTLEASPSATQPGGVGPSQCFQVGGTPPAPVAVGTYCLSATGVPVFLSFASGVASLTAFTPGAPAASVFTPATSPTPLPTPSK